MYRVGDKVEYESLVWEVTCLDYRSNGVFDIEIYNEKLGVDIWVVEDVLKPYKTAHEKLVNMGWEEQPTTIKNNKRYDNESDGTIFIDFEEKTYEVYENYEAYTIDLTLSRILTQYLEELEQ